MDHLTSNTLFTFTPDFQHNDKQTRAKISCSSAFKVYIYHCVIHPFLHMPPEGANLHISIPPYCDSFLLSQKTEGKNRGVLLHSAGSHTRLGELQFMVSKYHTVTSDFNAHRGIKGDYLDRAVGTSWLLATLCTKETDLIGGGKRRKKETDSQYRMCYSLLCSVAKQPQLLL